MSNFLQIKSIRRAAPLRNAARIISIMILTLLWPARGEAQTDLDVSSINAATKLSYKLKSEPNTYAWYYKIGEGSETEFSGKLTGTNGNCPTISIKSDKNANGPDYAGCATLQLEGVTLTANAKLIKILSTKPLCIQATGASPSTLKSSNSSVISNDYTCTLLLDGGSAGLNIHAEAEGYGIHLSNPTSTVEAILKNKVTITAENKAAVNIWDSGFSATGDATVVRISSGTDAIEGEKVKSPFLEWTFATAPASGQTLEIKDANGQSLRPAIEFTTDGKAKSFAINVTKDTPYTLWLGGKKQMDSNESTFFKTTEDKLISFSGITESLPSNWSEYAQTANVGPEGADVAVDNTTYTVKTPAGLAWIAWVTNEGKNNAAEADKYYPATAGFAGCTVTLANNISLTTPTTGVASSGFDASWPTIGKGAEYLFKGTFDGGSHTVSGLSLTIPNDRQYNGLFGYIENAVIKNLRVEGNIRGSDIMDNDIGVGGIVGSANNNSKIIACSNAVEISVTKTTTNGELNIGGIVGFLNTSKIYSCWNEASLRGTSPQKLSIGGIVGGSNSSIYNCYSSGPVSGTGTSTFACASGGIVGYIESVVVSNCYATGSVSATNAQDGSTTSAGGIAGHIKNVEVSYCLALNAGDGIKIFANGSTSHVGRIVGQQEGICRLDNNYASTKIKLKKGSAPEAVPTTEIGRKEINGADVYLDDVADAIKTWTGPENTKAFTAIDTVAITGMLPQLKAIDGYTNGLPSTYGTAIVGQPAASLKSADYLAMPTALELPAKSPTITLSFSDGKWSYQKEGGAPTRFTGTVKMAEGVNKAEIALVVSTATGNPTLTFENVYLNSTFTDLLTINNGCVLTLHAPDKPLHLTSGDSYGLINRGTLRVTGKGLSIEKANPTNYGFDNYGIFMVPDLAETSVIIFGNGQTMRNSGTLDNAWIEWKFDSRPSKIAFAATNQSPDVQELKGYNYATPVTPGNTYRLWKVTGDSPNEVRTRQTGTKDSKTVALFPAPAVGEKAVYTDVKNVEEVTIADSKNFSAAACSEKNVIVGTGGVLTIDAADAQVINLKLEKDGQVITTNALKVDETFSTTRTLANEWIAFGSPVALKASVGGDSLIYVGTGYTDAASSKQVWENVSGIPDTGTGSADLAADSPYLLATEEPSTKVTFTATAGTAPLEIPQTATVTPGDALADGVFLFQTNPNLSNLTLSNIYVLNPEGDRFDLHPGNYDVKPFEAYITANEVTCSRVRSLKIGDNIATGIDQPIATTTRIWGTRGTLHISADAPADVLIVTPAGRTLRSLKASAGETTLALPSGIYFVRCNGITYKISL